MLFVRVITSSAVGRSSRAVYVSGVMVDDEQESVLPLKEVGGNFCQGNSGSGDGVRGCALCFWALQHSGQFLTSSYSSMEIPGHQTDCLTRSLYFVMPWGPVWILLRSSRWSVGGITIRLPRISRPFSTANSADIGRYGRIEAVAERLSGHPGSQKVVIFWHTSSLLWCRLISSRR